MYVCNDVTQHPQLLPYFDRKGDMVEVPHVPKLGNSGQISSVIPFWLAHDVPSGKYISNYSITIPNYGLLSLKSGQFRPK